MKKFVISYTAFQVCFNLLFWVPIFYLYQKQFGLSDGQIFFIQSVYYFSFCLFEIPTGWLADRWDLKACLWAGSLVLVVCNLLPVFIPTYEGFLLHWVLVALSRSMVSGASSAYLYNFLCDQGRREKYRELEGRARAYSLIAKVIAWIFVGALLKWQVTSPYWLSAIAAALSTIAAFSLPATSRSMTNTARQRINFTMMDLASLGTKISFRRPIWFKGRMVWVILQGISLFVLVRLCQVNLFQPLLLDKGFSIQSFGVIMSAITMFEAVGSWQPGWLRRYVTDIHAVFLACILLGLLFLLFPWTGRIGTLAALGLFSLVAGVSFPIQKQLMNDSITNSNLRASILSIESMVDRLACALVAGLIGVFLENQKLHAFFLWAGVLTLLFTIFVTQRLQKES